MVAALAYVEETLIGAEVIRLTPSFLEPLVARLLRTRLRAHETVFKALHLVAEQRCLERDLAKRGHPVPNHADCIQWIMETSPKQKPWTATRVVHELMAIWFGSVHALSTTITFAIHDLCLHPEYVDPLRREITAQYPGFKNTGNGLPLLDSFIKESARLTPVEAMSTRRQALRPFTLSDGTQLGIGDWACTPVRSLMLDPTDYPQPEQFNGFRFVDPTLLPSDSPPLQPRPSKLTDVDQTWHVWGTGRMACPGRFYAAAVMKVILVQIILDYDFRLADPSASRWFTWRSSMLPRKATRVIFEFRPWLGSIRTYSYGEGC